MGGAPGPERARAYVRLVAVLVLIAELLTGSLMRSPAVLASGCAGDERILLAPAEPRVGSVMLVAVVSRTAHEHVLLLGPGGPLDVQRDAAGDRYVWQTTLVPERPGDHVFAFGVADDVSAMATCADAVIAVAGAVPGDPPVAPASPADASPVPTSGVASVLFASLHPWRSDGSSATGTSGPVADAGPVDGSAALSDDSTTATVAGGADTGRPRRPARTPTRRPRAENGNGNENDNLNRNQPDPTPTKTPRLTRTPTPTRTPTQIEAPLARTPSPTHTPRPDPTDTPSPTPTLAPPSIAGVDPPSAVCGQNLTISGARFGSSQNVVDGQVFVAGLEASIVSWDMTRIEIRVPRSAPAGNDRRLEVVVAGKTATWGPLRVSC